MRILENSLAFTDSTDNAWLQVAGGKTINLVDVKRVGY
jgi:hypothetical protein